MALKSDILAITLGDIIERLDDARNTALISLGEGNGYLEDLENSLGTDETKESIESAILEFENRIDELTDVLGEEIENLQRLQERLEDL